jgi:hypothetical protein
VFTGFKGKFVPLAESIDGFKRILAGETDDVPENAFFMVGPLAEVFDKAKVLAAESAAKRAREAAEEAAKKGQTAAAAAAPISKEQEALSGATPAQIEAYNKLKQEEKESRQYFADHPEEVRPCCPAAMEWPVMLIHSSAVCSAVCWCVG